MNWTIEKKRTASGFIIKAVRLTDSNITTSLTTSNFMPITEEDFSDK